MKLFAPDYLPEFSCIAGACRHSCCIGWEIDIDDDTHALYRRLPGAIGQRLSENIETSDGCAHFRLTEDERCPFLNGDGLCDLILSCGEDVLCQICADHPRFRNFFSDRTELGLGLCCEAAGTLILTRTAPVRLEVLEDDGVDDLPDVEEKALLALRSRAISIAQNRGHPIVNRIADLIDLCGHSAGPLDRWPDILLGLERLDESWTQRLNELRHTPAANVPLPEFLETALEQLLVYLLLRHLPGALDDGDPESRIAYCALITLLIRQLCSVHITSRGMLTPDDLVELARLYSSEIEYSDENLDAILAEIRTHGL